MKSKPIKNPETSQEWQDVMDIADAAIRLDAARKYGLVKGGPKVNLKRCQEIVELAKSRGHCVGPNSIQKFIAACTKP